MGEKLTPGLRLQTLASITSLGRGGCLASPWEEEAQRGPSHRCCRCGDAVSRWTSSPLRRRNVATRLGIPASARCQRLIRCAVYLRIRRRRIASLFIIRVTVNEVKGKHFLGLCAGTGTILQLFFSPLSLLVSRRLYENKSHRATWPVNPHIPAPVAAIAAPLMPRCSSSHRCWTENCSGD